MKPTIQRLLILAALTLGLALASDAPPAPAPPVVIVNKKNPVAHLRVVNLERIYRGLEDRWEDGQKIVPINRPVDSDIRRAFYKRVFNGPPSLKFFRPNSPIPVNTMVIPSDTAALRFVAHIPNAIAYVSADTVDDTVKVIAVAEW